jgi:putative selenate reductase
MGDKMRLLPFDELLHRILEEYRSQKSILDIPRDSWYRKPDGTTISIFEESCETVLGPAAGPHTQLAVNILSSYLTGSRFIELKTVQILDALELEKPCIDAHDEGYNTEWSTELALDEAWQEYAKGWILLHLIEYLFDMKRSALERSFIFNMSVGYDLKGILTEPMQRYISRMKDSSGEDRFRRWIETVRTVVPPLLKGTDLEGRADGLAHFDVSPRICRSVTLSTMHGCPPDEIESICTYMLTDQHLDTYVKLNPTLLGFDTVRDILQKLGYGYVQLDRSGFDHDLQYPQALEILTRLRTIAEGAGRRFGVKLTNTLAAKNTLENLPGDDYYLSGRALFPLSITLAARLSDHFQGDLPISYSGGITVHNAAAVYRTGIRPITLATDLLKPGGYLRQVQIARSIDEAVRADGDDRSDPADRIDVTALKALAAGGFDDPTLHKDFRGTDEVESPGTLPLYDCYEAPCVTACAIHQHIPEYIRLVGEERYDEALELIYERNALPSMTGHICDHQCQLVCTRLDYEGCISIREVKRLAVLHGMEGYRERWRKPEVTRPERVAVVGAGPTGLSAAYFLAREGFSVTVFEREADAGGVVRYVVPHFRISREAIESDVDFIRDHGVKFRFGVDEKGVTVQTLQEGGYDFVVIGVGTYSTRKLPIEGDNPRVHSSLPFLTQFNRDPSVLSMGRRVAVIGAGDTAMDCARSALRCPGVEEVTIVYRRAFEQMPATREEYELARDDGIAFHWLRNPRRFDADGTFTVEVMTLGEKDASGRRRPEPTGATETLHVDSIVYAIGDDPDAAALERLGLKGGEAGFATTPTGETDLENVFLVGDSRTGPSTIVQCIAEGRGAADEICRRVEPSWQRNEAAPPMDGQVRMNQIGEKRGCIVPAPTVSPDDDPGAYGRTELSRCLECDFVCNKCVDVCPNRANIAVPVEGEALFFNPFEIVHLDAYCNECGNCGHFCPWKTGVPYVDKPTVFSTREDFDNSENPGWLVESDTVTVRSGGETAELSLKEALGRGAAGAGGQTLDEARLYRLFSILHDRRPHLFGEVEAPVPGVPR